MFGRKKKRIMVAYRDADGTETELPLEDWAAPEAGVIALSVRFFHDPEPCEIHRGAVAQRMFLSLKQHILDKGWVNVHDLTEEEQLFFPDTGFVRLWEEA